jgi:hypothetical protein
MVEGHAARPCLPNATALFARGEFGATVSGFDSTQTRRENSDEPIDEMISRL